MDNSEGKKIIAEELDVYRAKNYLELISMIEALPVTYELKGAHAAIYQIEIQAFWDDKINGDVRIIGAIDDGGRRAFMPLSDDFIMSASGELVGE